MKEKEIIKKINKIWQQIDKTKNLNEIAICTIQIKQLFSVLGIKNLLEITNPHKPTTINKQEIKEIVKDEIQELKKYKE
jgi:hypothetical protein